MIFELLTILVLTSLTLSTEFNGHHVKRNELIDLPSGERISKRSAEPEIEDDNNANWKGNQETTSSDAGSSETVDPEDSSEVVRERRNIVFRPLFRSSRGNTNNQHRYRRAANEEDDLVAAENIVFRPVFRARASPVHSPRFRRSLSDDKGQSSLVRPVYRSRINPMEGYRFRRSIAGRKEREDHDLEAEESGMVFRPLFRSRVRNY